MCAGLQKLPSDFFDQVIILATALNLSLVTRRDGRGKPTELSVPYGKPSDRICGYRIIRAQDAITAEAVGDRPGQCLLTPDQERRLKALCEEVTPRGSRRRTPRKGPHRLVICT
jgi:hypothetical protein